MGLFGGLFQHGAFWSDVGHAFDRVNRAERNPIQSADPFGQIPIAARLAGDLISAGGRAMGRAAYDHGMRVGATTPNPITPLGNPGYTLPTLDRPGTERLGDFYANAATAIPMAETAPARIVSAEPKVAGMLARGADALWGRQLLNPGNQVRAGLVKALGQDGLAFDDLRTAMTPGPAVRSPVGWIWPMRQPAGRTGRRTPGSIFRIWPASSNRSPQRRRAASPLRLEPRPASKDGL